MEGVEVPGQAVGHGGNSWIPVYPRLQGTHWPAPASLVLSGQCLHTVQAEEQILWMNKGSESFVVCNRNIFSFFWTTVILECLSIIFQLLCHYGGTEQFLVSSSALKDITFLQSSHTLWVHITKWSVGANWRVVQLGCLLKITSTVISSWFPYLVQEWPNFWPGTEMRSQSIKKMVGPESHM